jgi:hypothetical protein
MDNDEGGVDQDEDDKKSQDHHYLLTQELDKLLNMTI